MEIEDAGTPSGPLALFCARLKRLQVASGITQASLTRVAHLGRTQMSNILNGKIKRLPDWSVTIEVVRACLEYADTKSRAVPPDLRDEEDWRRRYADLEHDLDTDLRPRGRREESARRLSAVVTYPEDAGFIQPTGSLSPEDSIGSHRERMGRENALLSPPVASWPRAADADPLVFGVHRARFLLHSGKSLPPYVRRDIDGDLHERLSTAAERGGLILLIGDSTAGKTRTAFEAMRRLFADYQVLIPLRDSDFGPLARVLDDIANRSLLWLDDLESYLRPGGLDPAVLTALIERRVPILATMRTEKYETYTSRNQFAQFGSAVLNSVEPIEISRLWSATELNRLAEQTDERLVEAATRHGPFGIAEYLAAGPSLLLEWHQASRVGGHPRGAALVSAAVDLARIGLRGPISEPILRRVHEHYLTKAGGPTLRPEPFDAALSWATQVRYGATSLLIPQEAQDTWQAFDYLVDAADRDGTGDRVPVETWNALLEHDLTEVDLFVIGTEAIEAGRKEVAESALLSLAEAGDPWAMYNLGCLYVDIKEVDAWVGWWGGGSAAALAAAKRADEAGIWWRRAAEKGHVESMYNLGLLLWGKGKNEEGDFWVDRAFYLGYRF
jgi:uncharacterized protein